MTPDQAWSNHDDVRGPAAASPRVESAGLDKEENMDLTSTPAEVRANWARMRRRQRLRGMFARLPDDEQFDAFRWLLDELPALADVMQDAIFDFEDAREARPPLRVVRS
jgi:hypothetical protein